MAPFFISIFFIHFHSLSHSHSFQFFTFCLIKK
jgi:hypothetical protein